MSSTLSLPVNAPIVGMPGGLTIAKRWLSSNRTENGVGMTDGLPSRACLVVAIIPATLGGHGALPKAGSSVT
jgi:hypothetical protein